MKYQIVFVPEALEDLKSFEKFDRTVVYERIKDQLSNEPLVETRNRKRLRTSTLSHWELRIGKYRVFYDVLEDEGTVKVIAVGYKEHNRLIIRGKEFEL